MGKISKTASSKHKATISPTIADFIEGVKTVPLYKLADHLDSFPSRWPFPRGDLYHWIPALNRFDGVLELFVETYQLVHGPQTNPFERLMLAKGDSSVPHDPPVSGDKINSEHGEEGDRECVEAIIKFTRLLLENCGNRSLYNSSGHLSHLLNTTSLSLLKETLYLGLRLSQRYFSALQRVSTNSHSLRHGLLLTHYQFDLEKMEQVALPFVKSLPPSAPLSNSTNSKSKDNEASARENPLVNPTYARNLLGMVKESSSDEQWKAFGGAWVSFYDEPGTDFPSSRPSSPDFVRNAIPASPSTPTPSRRTSGLGPNQLPRQRTSSSDDMMNSQTGQAPVGEPGRRPGLKVLELSSEKISTTAPYILLRDHVANVPPQSQYELLNRVRVARALSTSVSDRQEIVAIRLLAIANLSNIYPESQLQAKVFKYDAQETRPLQLPSQLCELIQPPSQGGSAVPRPLQTIALITLEALTKHKQKATEVGTALNVNVAHGVLLYVVRKYVSDYVQNYDKRQDPEFGEALFSLLSSLASSNPRTSESLVAVGLIDVLCGALTPKDHHAETEYTRVLSFLDNIVHQTRDAFQALVNAKGLDAIADLVAFEVENALKLAKSGRGIPTKYKTQVTDYQIPFVQHQIIRVLFKFMSHMMTVSGGAFDRLLRNLIESSQLLGALRTVISNAKIYGSTVWSSAITILSSFINNEPTSFAAIAEAGMIKALLDAVTQDPSDEIDGEDRASRVPNGVAPGNESGQDSSSQQNAIPPIPEAICTIPQVFGAICLNESGMRMLDESKALHKFFNIFLSPAHVKALAAAPSEVEGNLGSAFDELARHHPTLKPAIIEELTRVIRYAVDTGRHAATEQFLGAKVWNHDANGQLVVSGGRSALAGTVDVLNMAQHDHPPIERNGSDLEMMDVQAGEEDSATVTDQQVRDGEKNAFPILDYIDVISKFLLGFLQNTALCAPFAENDGIDLFLDLITSPAIPIDFHSRCDSSSIKRVLQLLVEQKPHLTVPSLINRADAALDQLQPFVEHSSELTYSSPFVSAFGYDHSEGHQGKRATNGTTTVKALVQIQTLCALCAHALFVYTGPRSSSNTPASLNLADMYVWLVKRLGKLQNKVVRELVCWQDKRRKAGPRRPASAEETGTSRARENGEALITDLAPELGGPTDLQPSDVTEDVGTQTANKPDQENDLATMNARLIWPVLSRIPHTIASLFAAIGRSILLKRLQMDSYQKQNVLVVADQIAQTLTEHLVIPDLESENSTALLSCWIFLGLARRAMVIDGQHMHTERPGPQLLTVIIQAFLKRGGIAKVGEILKLMLRKVTDDAPEDTDPLRSRALEGPNGILKFFSLLTNSKFVIDAHQTMALASQRPERDREKADFFSPAQFLVELRVAVMPAVLEAWNIDPIGKVGTQNMKLLMEILQNVLDGTAENGAFREADNIPTRLNFSRKFWKFRSSDNGRKLAEKGFSDDLAREALYRCNDNLTMAQEYCNKFLLRPDARRNPVPPYAMAPVAVAPELETNSTPASTSAIASGASLPPFEENDSSERSSGLADSLLPWVNNNGGDITASARDTQDNAASHPLELANNENNVTVEDLDTLRFDARNTLMERSLEVLAAYDEFTFELADLITAGVTKVPDQSAMREEVTETLIQALISFQSETDYQPKANKIVAHAHLLGIILQDKLFFEAGKPFVQNEIPNLMEFLKSPTPQSPSESNSWKGHILLILEKILAEDAEPRQVQFIPPTTESPQVEDIAEAVEPLVSFENKELLLDRVALILPRVGKDAALGLSAVRVLVILTRHPKLAAKLGLRKNMQRLFVMIKQLAGVMDEKLQGAFMLVLRHIVEDEEIIRTIMRTEVQNIFEKPREPRNIDTTQYIRHTYQLVLREPEIFVEVTNEMLMLPKFNRNQNPQNLALKKDSSISDENQEEAPSSETVQEPAQGSTEPADLLIPDHTEGLAESVQVRPTDSKAPTAETSDGLIHYLISELLAYKDVDDKELPPTSQPSKDSETSGAAETTADANSATSSATVSDEGTRKAGSKPTFKPEDHPIYVYRCFILQCMTELLRSYTSTKIDFLNFTRKLDAQTTPSKARSGVLNYLLNSLVPTGTIQHTEDIISKKKSSTSNWAISVITALCRRTPEKGHGAQRDELEVEDEPDLAHVRKLVLDHVLKAYRDASASNEALDMKYSRLLTMADLFTRMLEVKAPTSHNDHHAEIERGFPYEKQMSKLMFEKHFVTALTNSIADLDLNFPNANRAVKYILRPLKLLSGAATEFRFPPEDSTAAVQVEEDDDISSNGSVSEDAHREETPDLFRHSTLGMFEPGREEDSSSASSEEDDDEEMYGEEYADDMEYDEEGHLHDDDDVISDEDEDMEGMGPIEGLSGDMGMEVEIGIDDDDSEGTSLDEESASSDDDDDDESDGDEHDHDIDMEIEDAVEAMDDMGSDAGDGEEWQDEIDDGGHFADDPHAVLDMTIVGPGPPISYPESQSDEDAPDYPAIDSYDDAGNLNEAMEAMEADEHSQPPVDPDSVEEDDEDDDEEDLEDEGITYGDNEFDEDEEIDGMPGHFLPVAAQRHFQLHHHLYHRRAPDQLGSMLGLPRHERLFMPRARTHRNNGTPRANDDGINPLLHRARRPEIEQMSVRQRTQAMLDVLGPDGPGGVGISDTSMSMLSNIINSFGQGNMPMIHQGRGGGTIHFSFDTPPPRQFTRDFQGFMNLTQPVASTSRTTRDDPFQAVQFMPATTLERWQEEARLLFGLAYNEKASKVINSILKLLVPPALVAEKAQREKQQAEEAKQKKEKEEQAKKRREEEEAREAEEKAKAEEEAQRLAALAEEQEALAAIHQEIAEATEATESSADPATAMEGVEPSPNATAEAPVLDAAEAPAPRVLANIRGRQIDITELDIDPTWLDALPEEMVEEVIMQQYAERRSQATIAGEEPTAINPEFLDALPPDIRQELVQQEARERREIERQEARRRAAANGGPAHAEEMTPADLIASLNPMLRQSVLAEFDVDNEELLNGLTPEMIAEARAYTARHQSRHNRPMAAADFQRYMARSARRQEQANQPVEKKPRRVAQVLDKPGVATLLRLMFTQLHGTARSSVLGIFVSVSENRQIRNDILTGLLSILQDGSADVGAIERSFAQLTLRAKQSGGPKTPQAVKRTLTGQSGGEASPALVVGQCLTTLLVMTQSRSSLSSFFLSEHEIASGIGKSKVSKKGKGKDVKSSKFPVNALLGLLGRSVVIDNSTLMEQLTSLLQTITHPIRMLKKINDDKAKDAAEKERRDSDAGAADAAESSQPAVQPEDSTVTDAPPPVSDSATQAETAPGAATASASVEPDNAMQVETEEKPIPTSKSGDLLPPEVPEENLRLVVNVFTARDCSSVTFRDTMALMVNLSCIPEAKKIFGEELVSQARTLGETIETNLLSLTEALKTAETEMEAQGLALARFSPSSSDQAKLLRVLTALDYLFDQDTDKETKESVVDPVEEIMTRLHEHSSIGRLWNELSACLSVTHHSENYFFNIATILLPLIESLMIVCKRVSLGDIPNKEFQRDSTNSTPAPESGLKKVFFTFTDRHKKILNDLVRQTPKLMSGTFSVLVKNPTVLEFDNKRNYFSRKLHHRGPEVRHYHHPSLQLNVRRETVFTDSYKALHFRSGEEIKYGKFNIRFVNEEGVDAGGVTREWFQVLARQMFNPDYALFNPVASDRTTFHPNPVSTINDNHLRYFKFIGQIIGKALYEGRVLDCHFSRAVYKRILGKSVSMKDMETLDLDYTKSMQWILENDITDIITETFSVEIDRFGVTEVVDLIENGRNIPVTEENKHEYVRLVVEYRLTGSVQEQLEYFLTGFHDIVPAKLISIFDEGELELLISGMPEVDVDDWRSNTDYHQYTASSSQIQWFWRAVRSFDKEERAKLLQFVTGTGKVPLNGFKELEGMNGFTRFSIHKDYGSKDRLPSSHTCFNQLDLPEYDSYESLRKQLYTAMTTGNEYFGYA